MFPQTINSNLTADEKVSRLVRQAMLNVSQHFARLSLHTDSYTLNIREEVMLDLHREYIISLLYSINENIAVINFTGSKDILDAFFLSNLDARSWYDDAINYFHENMMEDDQIKQEIDELEEMLNVLRPRPDQAPLPDELGDDEALTSEEREALADIEH